RSLRIVRAEQITPGRRLAQRPEAPRLFLVGEPRIAFRERDRFAEQELAAAPVEREPLAYRGTVIPTGLDFQAGDDAPPVHGAIDEPAPLEEVTLLGAELLSTHQLVPEEQVPRRRRVLVAPGRWGS